MASLKNFSKHLKELRAILWFSDSKRVKKVLNLEQFYLDTRNLKKTIQKIKLQTALFHSLRYNNSQQDTTKLNPSIYKNNYTSLSMGIYFKYTRLTNYLNANVYHIGRLKL
jgi:hypothetical protein